MHSVRVQLWDRGPPGRGRQDVRANPWRQTTPGVEGLHVREGAAARLLPERPGRARAAPTTSPGGRHVRGNRLGHRDPRSRRTTRRGTRRAWRRQDPLLRRRRTRQPSRRRVRGVNVQGVRRQVPVVGDRTGEGWRDPRQRPDVRHSGARRVRALRGRVLHRQEPLHDPRHPPRPNDAEGDRQRPDAVDDRDRPEGHRDSPVGRLPSPGPSRSRRLAARGDGGRHRPGRPHRSCVDGRTRRRSRGSRRCVRGRAHCGVLPDRRRRRGSGAAGDAFDSRRHRASPRSRTSAYR